MKWLDKITDSMDINQSEQTLGDGEGKPGVLRSMGSQRAGNN